MMNSIQNSSVFIHLRIFIVDSSHMTKSLMPCNVPVAQWPVSKG